MAVALLEGGSDQADFVLETGAAQGKTDLVEAVLKHGKRKQEKLDAALASATDAKVIELLEKAGAKKKPKSTTAKIDPAVAGTYRDDAGTEMKVQEKDGKLSLNVGGAGSCRTRRTTVPTPWPARPRR